MAKLLIIGGSGFFGKSILDAYKRNLLKKWDIKSIDVISRSAENLKKTNPDLIGGSISLHNLDISSCNSLPMADFIIHAASSTDASRYISRPQEEKLNIIASVKNYCDIAKLAHRKSKIIYTSSGAIYGQQPSAIDRIKENYNINLSDELVEHKRDYSVAKRDAENLIQNLGGRGNHVSIARCFNFIGPYLPLDQHFAFGNFIKNGIMNQNIIVNARHEVIRAHQYTDDLVNWLMTIAEAANSSCPIYNVGSERSIEMRGLAELVAKYFNVGISMNPIDDQKIDRYVPSTEKARNELGLVNSVDLEEALDKTAWKIKNTNIY